MNLAKRKYLLLILIYSAIFISIYGIYILNPLYTDWCKWINPELDFDIFINYLASLAFLNSDTQIPYFENTIYPFKIGVLYSDQAPLIAIFLKIFLNIFKAKNFVELQYSGILGLFNFVITGILSFAIIKKLTKTTFLNAFLASVFFVTAPIMLDRFPRNYTLGSQWLILLSFLPFCFFREISLKIKLLFSFFISFLSCGIHISFIPVIFINIIAYAVYDYFQNKNIKNSVLYIFSFLSGTLTAFLLFGGFSDATPLSNFVAFRYFSANMATFAMPDNNIYANKSLIFPFLNNLHSLRFEQHEGYAYLGAGIIILFILSCFYFKKLYGFFAKYKTESIIFTAVFLITYLYSLSPDCILGDKLILSIPFSEKTDEFLDLYRTPGRNIMNCVFMIYFLVLIATISNFRQKISLFSSPKSIFKVFPHVDTVHLAVGPFGLIFFLIRSTASL